jgi:hypothetical protein
MRLRFQSTHVAVVIGFAIGTFVAVPSALALAKLLSIGPGQSAQAEPVADLLREAARNIRDGDIVAARSLLLSHEADAHPEVLFHLAETFDPNMLAAWNARNLRADAQRALVLYRKSQELGLASAGVRIAMLY